jgi:hypothetical protein
MAIRTAKDMILDNETEERLAYIKANFSHLPSNITRNSPGSNTFYWKLENIVGYICNLVSSKMKGVLEKKTLATKQCAPPPEC